ncbi:MAG: hypothetical protein V4697_03855 [Patescibacteria group bacterium]
MAKVKKTGSKRALFHDILMILFGVMIAVIFVKTGVLDFLISSLKGYVIIASFVAGIFFTSAFTLAPASIALVSISQYAPTSTIALWGGLGAMCGDLILFFFIRDRFAEDLMKAMKPAKIKSILHSFHFGFLKWLSPILGALIIASPLPDEFGITLMGISKVRVAILMPIAFVMNVLGIYLLIQFSHLI